MHDIAAKKGVDLPEIISKNASFYQRMILDRDTHFYNIFVNTSHSSVHVPTNVYDRSPNVLRTIMWSEGTYDNIHFSKLIAKELFFRT